MMSIMRRPSAWLPVALSLVVLALWAFGIAAYGPPAREADEGTAAHLFQLWLALEVVLVAFFAIRWLPQSFRRALPVLLVQISLAAAACAPVVYFDL